MAHMEVPTLGKPTDATSARDAVHVAIFPAFADCALSPGDLIRVTGERQGNAHKVAPCGFDDAHGVVDPFLADPLPPGAGFWGVLKPGSVTSLRHIYFHPAFKAAPPVPEPA